MVWKILCGIKIHHVFHFSFFPKPNLATQARKQVKTYYIFSLLSCNKHNQQNGNASFFKKYIFEPHVELSQALIRLDSGMS